MRRNTKIILGIIYIFILLHFFKDITQDTLGISTPLDIFGNVKEDISFLPYSIQLVFGYSFGGLPFIVEAFLLIAITKLFLKKQNENLRKWIFAGILYLLIFFLICILLDPRFIFVR